MNHSAMALALVAAVILAVAGCNAAPDDDTPAAADMNIRDVQWRITEVRGGPVQPADQPIALTLATADERVTGYTGVNRFGGGYELEGESLSFGALVMTRRAGPQPLMDQETAITRALEAVRAWRPAPGGGVELLDEQGTVVLKLSRGE